MAKITDKDSVYYPDCRDRDRQWGLVCTNVGKRNAGSGSYPEEDTVLDEYRLVYITDGQGLYHSAQCIERQVGEGDIIIVFPGEKHRFAPDPKTGWTEMWIGFTGDGHLADVLSGFFDKSSPVISIGSSDTVFDIYGRVQYLAKTEKAGCQQAMGGFILALLGYVYHKDASLSVSRIKHLDRIQQAQMMLRNDLTAGISPAEVASRLGISYSLLREQFKAVTGISMADYILSQRMNHAKTLLNSSDKSVKEIAFETGYESLSRFCCAFKQATGITASEFRKRSSGRRAIR